MTPDDKLKVFEKNLAGKVEEQYQALVAALQLHLHPREQAVFAFALSKYSAGGRWYDKWGIPDSVLDTLYIVEHEGKERGLVLPILAMHDTGYPSLEDTANYAAATMRELHMRVGAQYAAELYCWKDPQGNYLFGRNEVHTIAAVVAHHDDHYLGEPTSVFADPTLLNLYKTFVDCDRTFVPNFVSAYKDYVSRYARESYGSMTGEQFLAMRIASFFKQKDPEVENIGIFVPGGLFTHAQAKGKYGPLHLAASRSVVAAHLKARKQECDIGLFRMAQLGDWNSFEQHAEDYFAGSIASASQRTSYDVQRFGL